MANATKYVDYSIVPWYNSAEWRHVYELIFNEKMRKDDLQSALEIIATWQMRTPLLPSGIEGTLCILEAFLIDEKEMTDRQYQILCASSIMRFLNICVASRAAVFNFTKTAKDNSIPDWIISIRHDFAHSQRLPSISLLKLALNESFKWLRNTYWKPELSTITDNIISGSITQLKSSLSMHELIGLYCNLLVYDAKDLCYDEFIQNKLELVDANSKIDEYPKVIMTLLDQGTNDFSNFNWRKCMDEMMYSKWFILHPNSLIDEQGNCNQVFTNFNTLMNFLEKHQQVVNVVSELLYIAADECELHENCLGASLWLNEIFIGIARNRNRMTEALKELKGFGLTFKRVQKETIVGLKNVHQQVESIRENYRKHFLHSYLLASNGRPDVKSLLKELEKKSVCSEQQIIEDLLKVQTEEIENSKKIESILNLSHEVLCEETSSDQNEVEDVPMTNSDKNMVPKRWKHVKDSSMFESCAFGVLPMEWS